MQFFVCFVLLLKTGEIIACLSADGTNNPLMRGIIMTQERGGRDGGVMPLSERG